MNNNVKWSGYRFIREGSDGKKVISEIATEHVSLTELLETFDYFLKGCSFIYNGEVDIVEYQEVEFEPEKEIEN